jgi:hypothetical protein
MLNSRRDFLRSGAVAVAGMTGAASAVAANAVGRPIEPGPGEYPVQGPQPAAPLGAPLVPASRMQVPKVKFGNAEISRLVIGCNTFYGWAHHNNTLGTVMKEWFNQEKVCEVLHQCNRYGINAYNYLHAGRAHLDLERFRSEGGRMHLIVQGTPNPEAIVKAVTPLAMYHHGEMTDQAFQNGKKEDVREYCRKLRQLGVLVGVGSHKPEVIATVEEEGWDVDFYAGCVYNRTRTPDEFRKMLNGELPLPAREIYLESDPPRMYKVLRQTSKPCFAFKILAAGRIESPDDLDAAYRLAFASLKPTDCVFVGMFPRIKDEVRDNAERVHRILKAGSTSSG